VRPAAQAISQVAFPAVRVFYYALPEKSRQEGSAMTRTKICRLATIVMVIVLVAGCASTGGDSSSAMPASAADAATVERIRDKYYRAYPESRVGVVIAVLKDDPFAAVGELPSTSDFQLNQVVTFIDRSERVLTTGTVVRILPDSVHVRYDPPPRGGRTPRRGDIMIRTPFGAQALSI
jgi:hypothetical protein